MKTTARADLQTWSDEVARDPRSLAFLPLARAYRKQGLRQAALQLCLRGLEAYPEHVEAHGLLALLHLEAGDHQKAADEWSIVLRLEPDNFDALRGMGFWCFERDQLSRARDLLERAAAQRPQDATVRELLHELGTRDQLLHEGLARVPGVVIPDDPWATPMPPAAPAAPAEDVAAAATVEVAAAREPAPEPVVEPVLQPPPMVRGVTPPRITAEAFDPSRLFDALLATGPLLGALLVDSQGLVLAGRLTAAAESDAATLGAVLGNAVMEAARTATHLGLGNWRGVLIESQHALLHVKPVDGRNALVIAAGRDAPAGWLLRTSAHAAEQALRYVEEYG